jgi:hypothetical protein
VDRVLAAPPPFFARCPIFRNQSSHVENRTERASQDPGKGVKHPIPRVGKGVPGFGIERSRPPVKELARWTTTRVHAECNSVLHSARPRVLHPAGGPYITFIAKQMDKNSAGTQLYRQRVCFFLPLCLLALYQHNQCKFVFKKWMVESCFYFLTNLF